MATLTTHVVPHTGLNLEPLLAPVTAAGDQAATGSGVVLAVKNGDSVQHTITLPIPEKVDGLGVTSRAVTVAAGAQELIPLPDLYKDPASGLAAITYDAGIPATVTAAVVRVA